MNRLFAFPCPLYQIVELGLIVAVALFPDDKGIGHAVHDLPYHLQTGQALIQTGMGGNFSVHMPVSYTHLDVYKRQEVNRGKGGALKTAFAWFLEHTGEDLGVVTVDGDGQHTAADALRCARELEAHPDSLVLGVRQFDGADVPLRSRIGNQATIWCFRVLCGVGVSDTQTGLRSIGTDFLRALCTVPGDRYEFETNMLLATSRLGIPIREVPIRTVYLEQNATRCV